MLQVLSHWLLVSIFVFETESSYTVPGCAASHYIVQAGLEIIEFHPKLNAYI